MAALLETWPQMTCFEEECNNNKSNKSIPVLYIQKISSLIVNFLQFLCNNQKTKTKTKSISYGTPYSLMCGTL